MKHLTYALLGLFVLLCGAAGASARELIIGVEDLPYLPYYTTGRDGYRGYARELLDAFAAQSGLRLQYRALPVERLYHALLNGRVDCKFPDHPDWRPDLKSDHTLYYSGPIAPFVDGVMVRPERGEQPLDGFRRIGTVRGFTPWPLLPLIEQGRVQVSENNSIPGLLRQTLSGRVDGAYINVAVARYQLRHGTGDASLLVLDTRLPHDASGYRLSCTRDAPFIEELNTWLAANRERIGAMRRKWGISD